MDHVLDAVLEVFSWVGFGGAIAVAVVWVVVWAADGTWLPAEAIVDRDGGDTVLRWFDGDGDADSAVATAGEVEKLSGRDTVSIWYRHGWHGRMRLHRRASSVTALAVSALGLLALGILSLAVSWILLFAGG